VSSAIRTINDALYNEITIHARKTLQGMYILDVIKLSKDIYIEVRDWTERDLQMTIYARKIISIGKCGVGSITKYEMESIN